MFKTSVATRVISVAVLITLLLASFPTAASAARTNNRGLETKWARLVDRYYRQSISHNSAHRWVDLWMNANRRAPHSQKAELLSNLAKSDSAWASATVIAMQHRGFDANGNVVDKAAAQQSIKDLARALQHYAGSIKNLKTRIHQFNKGE
jgi:predicted component of type VI protein secretion system